MIIKGKDVIGLKVVTVDTGSVVQTVDDIAYDPKQQRVIALFVSAGGLFSSAKAIHMDDVRNIGQNAVIVPNAQVIKSIKQLGDTVRSISDSNKHLVRTDVLTADGKELGRVSDIYFDSASGKVDMMEVSQGGLKTMTEGKKSIKPSDIVTIGADATIVSTYTELSLEAQGEEGGLKGIYNGTKEKAAQLAAETKESMQEAAEKTAANAKVAAAAVREKAEEIQDRAAVTAAEARVKTDELRNDISKEARKRIKDSPKTFEAAVADVRRSRSRASAAVVEKSSRRYEDGNKVVATKKTVVKK